MSLEGTHTKTQTLHRPARGGPPRKERAQVVRACDACRLHRIKCDNHVPCSNYDARGSRCSNATIKEMSPSKALREIERLRAKVRELEGRLQDAQHRVGARTADEDSPRRPALSSSLKEAPAPPQTRQHFPDGIRIPAGTSGNETWYGVSSLFHFISRVSSFMSTVLDRPCLPKEMLNPSSSSSLLDETQETKTVGSGENSYLRPVQEEYFPELYWQSYHTSVFPILDEAEFERYYRSLCTTQGSISTRQPSAIVDIVVAICIQMGFSSQSTLRAKFAPDPADATIAGRCYYIRSQQLLAYELENPTLSTLQCQLLSAVYLCSSTFHNMSDSACAAAVHTAYMLGLHLDLPEHLPAGERQMRCRIWWTLYILDSKIGIKYGRPFSLPRELSSSTLPDDNPGVAAEAGSDMATLGNNLSWLTFHREHARLFFVARNAFAQLYEPLTGESAVAAVLDRRDMSNAHAETIKAVVGLFEDWTAGVPGELQVQRAFGGHDFSTTMTDLDPDLFSPLWLERQRLLLELTYHNVCVTLYRPFICFGSAPVSNLAVEMALKSAEHAMAITSILHQVVTTSTVLTGWHEAFQWQWNAAMTLLGVVLASVPVESTSLARQSIEHSITVLEDFAKGMVVAAKAVNVVRKAQAKLDNVLRARRTNTNASERGMGDTSWQTFDVESSRATVPVNYTPSNMDLELDFADTADLSFQDILNMASDVDQHAEPHMIWADM